MRNRKRGSEEQYMNGSTMKNEALTKPITKQQQ